MPWERLLLVTPSTNSSLSQDYPQPDNHIKHITDNPGFKPCTIECNVSKCSHAWIATSFTTKLKCNIILLGTSLYNNKSFSTKNVFMKFHFFGIYLKTVELHPFYNYILEVNSLWSWYSQGYYTGWDFDKCIILEVKCSKRWIWTRVVYPWNVWNAVTSWKRI